MYIILQLKKKKVDPASPSDEPTVLATLLQPHERP